MRRNTHQQHLNHLISPCTTKKHHGHLSYAYIFTPSMTWQEHCNWSWLAAENTNPSIIFTKPSPNRVQNFHIWFLNKTMQMAVVFHVLQYHTNPSYLVTSVHLPKPAKQFKFGTLNKTAYKLWVVVPLYSSLTPLLNYWDTLWSHLRNIMWP